MVFKNPFVIILQVEKKPQASHSLWDCDRPFYAIKSEINVDIALTNACVQNTFNYFDAIVTLGNHAT